jgi:hypothetical protein
MDTFNSTPQTVADLNRLVTLIGRMGNLRVGPQSDREALSGTELFEGLHFYDTTLDLLFKYDGSGWKQYNLLVRGGNMLFGTAPSAGSYVFEQMGLATATTVASGDASIIFPQPFPNGVIWASVQRRDFTSYGATHEVLHVTQGLDRVNFRVFNAAGTAIASAPTIPYVYRAIGW